MGNFTNSTLVGGWFAGDVDAAVNGDVGGLIGDLSGSSVRDNWAIGRVSVGDQFIRVGGLFGASRRLLRDEQLVGQFGRERAQSRRRCSGGGGFRLFFRSDLLGIGN